MLEKKEKSPIGRNRWHKIYEMQTFSEGLNITASKHDKIATPMAQVIQNPVKKSHNVQTKKELHKYIYNNNFFIISLV